MPPASQPVATSSNANPITSVPGPDEGSDVSQPLALLIYVILLDRGGGLNGGKTTLGMGYQGVCA